MQLTAALFQQVTSSARATAADRTNKRNAPRIGLQALATVVPLADGKAEAVERLRVRDVSATGISVLRPVPMRSGRNFIVYLPRLDDKPAALFCEVRHCRAVAENLYAIGAQFTKPTAATFAAPPAAATAATAPASNEPDGIDAAGAAELARIRAAILS